MARRFTVLLAVLPQLLQANEDWTWTVHASAFPAGLNAVATSGSAVVTVGGEGVILTSPDGASWTRQQSGSERHLLDVAWSGTHFVAVGRDGTILRSADGESWSASESGSEDTFEHVASNGQTFVVSTPDGRVGVSVSGLNWTFHAAPFDSLSDLIAADGIYAGVRGSSVFFSHDGRTWVEHALDAFSPVPELERIAHDGDRWIATDGHRLYIHSAPPANFWSELSGPGPFGPIVTSGNELRSIHEDVLLRREDGTWVRQHRALRRVPKDVVWSGSRYVAIDSSGEIALSTDSAEWSYPIHPGDAPYLANHTWTGERFVALNEYLGTHAERRVIFSSDDGLHWIRREAPHPLHAVTRIGDSVFLTGENQLMMRSTDHGRSWELIHERIPGPPLGPLFWDGSRFVASAFGAAYVSADGTSWTNLIPHELRGVLWTGQRYLAISTYATYISSDAVHWTETAYAARRLLRLSKAGGSYFALGAEGYLLQSPDGETWTASHIPEFGFSDVNGVAWTGNEFVAVASGMTARSVDGITWTPTPLPTSPNLGGIAWNGSVLVTAGHTGFSTSTDGTAWSRHKISETTIADIIWDGSRFIAVGCAGEDEHGVIYTSSHGEFWGRATHPEVEALTHVIAAGDLRVAVSDEGQILTSGDGLDWTLQEFSLEDRPRALFPHKSGAGVLLAYGRIVTSLDGERWTSGPPRTSGHAHRLHWNGNQFLMSLGLFNLRTAISPDGEDWTESPMEIPWIHDVFWDGDKYIAAGKAGSIHTSTDGLSWQPVSPLAGTQYELRRIARSDSTIVVVGHQTLYSDDGNQWTVVPGNLPSFDEILWDGTHFVAFSSNEVFTSADGRHWASAGRPGDWNDVAWSGERFVAVGERGRIAISLDGRHWNLGFSNSVSTLSSVSFANGQFFAGAEGGGILRSTDGLTWIHSTPGIVDRPPFPYRSGGLNFSIEEVASNGAAYVALAAGAVQVSSDANRWELRLPPFPLEWVVSANGTFRAGGLYGDATSLDGDSWTKTNAHTPIRDATYANGLFVAVSDYGMVLTSPDGSEWTLRDTPTTNHLRSVTWVGHRFYAAGYRGVVLHSLDGLAWSFAPALQQSVNSTIEWIHWTGTRLIAGSDSTVYAYIGGSWRYQPTPPGRSILDFAANESVMVTVGEGGFIMTSLDGLNWARRESPTNRRLLGVDWTGSCFVATGSNGTILFSEDGTTWTSRDSGVSSTLNAAGAIGSRLVVAGSDDRFLVSDDGLAWAAVDPGLSGVPAYFRLLAANDELWAFGSQGTILSTADGLGWDLHRRTIAMSDLAPVHDGAAEWVIRGTEVSRAEFPDRFQIQAVLDHAGGAPRDFKWTGSRFIAVGSEGVLSISANGRNWQPQQPGVFIPVTAVASSPQRIVAVGEENAIVSTSNPVARMPSFSAWVCAVNIQPGQDGFLDVNHPGGIPNLLAYALDLPLSGAADTLPLLPAPLRDGGVGIAFSVPSGGRDDLRYIAESSLLLTPESWSEVTRKEFGRAWVGPAQVRQFALAGQVGREQIEIRLPAAPQSVRRFFRLRVELVTDGND